MSVILVTGATGSGKTSLIVDWLANGSEFRNRPLYAMGIPELQLEHQPVPPVDQWTELRESPEDPALSLPYFVFPEHAVIVLDEAQRVFRTRPVGSKVPAEVQAFETHRHTGVDFILLTQHPNLLDSNVRRLVRRHHHIHETPLQTYLLEWPRLGDVDSASDRELAVRQSYKPSKRVFSLYKSAEAHTVTKRSVPRYVWLAGLAGLSAIALLGYGYNRVKAKVDTSPVMAVDQMSSKGSKARLSDAVPPLSTADYIAAYTPRLPGLQHTAPAYDDVTKPREAPVPMGCVQNHRKRTCRCIDQQGNNYSLAHELCIQIVRNGLFIPWAERKETASAAVASARDAAQRQPEPQASPPAVEIAAPPADKKPGDNDVFAQSVPARPVPDRSPWRYKPHS